MKSTQFLYAVLVLAALSMLGLLFTTGRQKTSFEVVETPKSRPYCRKRLAVVTSYHISQMAKLKKQIAAWEKYPPCRAEWECIEQVDLFYAISDAHNATTKALVNKILDSVKNSRECFGNVIFFDTRTPKQWDTYRPAASSFQFYDFFKRPEIKGVYDYWFLMEPDVYPVRKNWIEHVYAETLDVSPFWIKGSIAFRGACISHPKHTNRSCSPSPNPLEERFNGHWFVHINGNAIYNVNDPEFAKFRQDVIDIMGMKYFDSSMGEVMLRTNYDYPFWSFYASRFRYSEFIIHSARRPPQYANYFGLG